MKILHFCSFGDIKIDLTKKIVKFQIFYFFYGLKLQYFNLFQRVSHETRFVLPFRVKFDTSSVFSGYVIGLRNS